MAGIWDQIDPVAAPQGSALPAPVTAGPAGSNQLIYRDTTTKGSADNSNESLTQAQGAIESAGPMTRLLNMASAPAAAPVFGPMAGSGWMKSVNAGLGKVFSPGFIPGDDATALASQQERLTGAYNSAAIPMIKQLFGTLPRSSDQQDRALEVLGGTTVSDQPTAVAKIKSAMQAGVDKINAAISDGRVTPAMVQRQIPPGYPFSFNPQSNRFEPNAQWSPDAGVQGTPSQAQQPSGAPTPRPPGNYQWTPGKGVH
jgi:hypothetical protein